MTIKNARSISPKELGNRRRQAVNLFKSGHKRKDIAPIVGAHRNVIGQWIRSWQEEGESSFQVSQPGRPRGSGRRLKGWEASMIKRLITDNVPDQLKFSFALWNRKAVQILIKDRLGIALSIRSIGNYLKRWGFTPQRPVCRAYERNNVEIARWLEEEYPSIAKRARQDQVEIHWGDETGIRSDDVNGRGYSPKGKTPIVRKKGKRERLSMFSTVTNRGKLRFSVFEGSINGEILIDFLKRLIRDTDKKVFVILDNLKVHHCKPVKEWFSIHEEFIEVFYLPRYSPELNPDELLNSDFKREVRNKPDSRHKGSLKKNVRSVMQSIQKQPQRVIKYFHAPSTKYAL